MEKSFQKKLIEAALFMSPKAIPLDDLKKTIETDDLNEVDAIAIELLDEFNSRDSALEIAKLENSLQMRVKKEFESRVAGLASGQLFHKGIMKTLALIAFKQPIKQSDLIKYRNVKAYDHIARLLLEGFISKEAKGRTYVIKTTKKFLDYFGTDYLKEDKSKTIAEEPE